jgi:hypothetical protein
MFMTLAKHIELLAPRIASIGDPIEATVFDPREPLVWVWCVLDTMPNDQDQRYQRLPERSVNGTGIEDRAEVVRANGYAMPGLTSAIDSQIPWLAGLARALDDDLADLGYWPEDVSEWSPDEWRPPDYECFVIPVRREHRIGEGRPAQRRGLVFNAVLPQRIGSLEVTLHLHPDASASDTARDPAHWTYGAAIFPGLSLVPLDTSESGYRLAGAPLSGDDRDVLAGQVAGAKGADCDVMVWPELTMPADRLRELKAQLAAAPLDDSRIGLVVAGSWHVEAEPALHVNRSEVLLNDGEPIVAYDKRRRFPWVGRDEDISVGKALPVIVMEDRLIGIAICRDNCDDNAKESYKDLPLDLVIVPSMGGLTTLDAQTRHAQSNWTQQGTLTLLVQQVPAIEGQAGPEGSAGYSFVRPAQKNSLPIGQDVPFRTLK